MELQIKKLFKDFNELQTLYGDKNLSAIYGAGRIKNPKLCFVFMNPTSRNVSSNKNWKGLRAPWIGTKNVWKFLNDLDLIDEKIFSEIIRKKPEEWSYEFAEKVYEDIAMKSLYITNLCKATQKDAKPISKKVLLKYLDLFQVEIKLLNPQIIVSFGSEVSSVLLGKNIKISECRGSFQDISIQNRSYKVFPTYYPVGQGIKNMKRAEEDLKLILD